MDNNYAPPQSDVAAGNSTGGVSNKVLTTMGSTKPWVLTIGIVLIVASVFIFLGALALVSMVSRLPTMPGQVMLAVGVYVVMGVVQIVLGIYLIKFSSAIGRLLVSRDNSHLEESLVSQKKFWVLAGIVTVLGIILSVVGLVAGMSGMFGAIRM